jgi:hypothetical protein
MQSESCQDGDIGVAIAHKDIHDSTVLRTGESKTIRDGKTLENARSFGLSRTRGAKFRNGTVGERQQPHVLSSLLAG